jgi:hypothetical protein
VCGRGREYDAARDARVERQADDSGNLHHPVDERQSFGRGAKGRLDLAFGAERHGHHQRYALGDGANLYEVGVDQSFYGSTFSATELTGGDFLSPLGTGLAIAVISSNEQ